MLRSYFALILWLTVGLTISSGGVGKNCLETSCEINDTTIRFFVIGDWGGESKNPYVTPAQQHCADLTMEMGPYKKPQFFVGPGDNFYKKGVKNAEDKRFKKTFDDVFLYGKEASVPWYMVAGNHDWFGNVSAQIAYSQVNKRWIFPDYNYSATFNATPNGPSAEIIMIDTIVLCGIAWDTDQYNETGQPSGPSHLVWAENLWKWIEHEMAESKSDYLFVVGHYPAFAADNHNISDCLVPRLQDLLGKYNATAYIAGHAHNLQHLTTRSPSNHTIHHVISGGGHSLSKSHHPFNLTSNPWHLSSEFFFPKKKKDEDMEGNMNSKFKMGGFVYVELGENSGTIDYYKCDGTFLYTFQFEPRIL